MVRPDRLEDFAVGQDTGQPCRTKNEIGQLHTGSLPRRIEELNPEPFGSPRFQARLPTSQRNPPTDGEGLEPPWLAPASAFEAGPLAARATILTEREGFEPPRLSSAPAFQAGLFPLEQRSNPPGGTRTPNFLIKSQLRFQLRHGGRWVRRESNPQPAG